MWETVGACRFMEIVRNNNFQISNGCIIVIDLKSTNFAD